MMKTLSREIAATEAMEEEFFFHVNNWGTKTWTNDKGQFHREDGPALERLDVSGLPLKCWYQNGSLHRLDGPSDERPHSAEWWFQGKFIASMDSKGILTNHLKMQTKLDWNVKAIVDSIKEQRTRILANRIRNK